MRLLTAAFAGVVALAAGTNKAEAVPFVLDFNGSPGTLASGAIASGFAVSYTGTAPSVVAPPAGPIYANGSGNGNVLFIPNGTKVSFAFTNASNILTADITQFNGSVGNYTLSTETAMGVYNDPTIFGGGFGTYTSPVPGPYLGFSLDCHASNGCGLDNLRTNQQSADVPEPASLAILGMSLAVLAAVGRRRVSAAPALAAL